MCADRYSFSTKAAAYSASSSTEEIWTWATCTPLSWLPLSERARHPIRCPVIWGGWSRSEDMMPDWHKQPRFVSHQWFYGSSQAKFNVIIECGAIWNDITWGRGGGGEHEHCSISMELTCSEVIVSISILLNFFLSTSRYVWSPYFVCHKTHWRCYEIQFVCDTS